MKLFEKSDVLNSPVDCVYFDASKETFPVRAHWHYFMEIIYVYSGTISVVSNEKKYLVKPGEMILFPPKDIHAIDSNDEPKYALIKFDVNRIKMDSALKIHQIFNNMEDIYPVFSSTNCENIEVKEILENCIKEMNKKEYGFTSIIYSYVYILLTRIIQIWKKEKVEMKRTIILDNSIYNVTEYIDSHSNENININDLAKMCGMSYSYFAKSFKELYKQSCKEFINYIRINKACEFLMFTNYDMNQISQETGFTDASHFIRTFKEIKKTTPKQYRLEYLKGITNS